MVHYASFSEIPVPNRKINTTKIPMGNRLVGFFFGGTRDVYEHNGTNSYW